MKHDHNTNSKKVIYVCPMHPDVRKSERGTCPECHMALEKKTVDQAEHNHQENHDKHAGHSVNMFKQKFWLSLVLTLPILYFSQTVQSLFDFTAVSFPGSSYIPAILGFIIFMYGGLVFLRGGKAEIENRQPGMMTLISLAISVAFVYSLMITFNIVDGMDFWWELASLVTIMLLGHWLEMASIMNAEQSLNELAKLLPDEAEIVTKDGTKTVAVSDLVVGSKILIRPGGQIPIDGIVLKGESKVNESMLTGESKPINKSKDDQLVAGSVNGSGSLTVKVTKVGDDTALSGIMRLVAEAQSSKSKTQLLADKAAGYLFYIALLAALLTAIGWGLFTGQSSGFVLTRVVAVLIIACPHALGLAIPLVSSISSSKAAKEGLLIRKRSALELSRNVDIVVFDKTGTLTTGEQGVVGVIAKDKQKLLAIASAIEQESEHSLAKTIVAYAKQQKVAPRKFSKFSALEGRGAKAVIGKKTYYIGGPQLIKQKSLVLSDAYQQANDNASKNGQTTVYVLEDKEIIGALMIADTIRKESKQAVKMLQRAGKKVAIITGDSEGTAQWVANTLGVDEYHAEVLPGSKSEVVMQLQASGSKVAFVGDGVNDAPALTRADVGIAIGAGTDVAIESAGIVLIGSDPRGVLKIINLSKVTYQKMWQNLMWATGYNVIAIPLAAGVLAGYGLVLSPAVGAVLMSLSTIIVAFNAQLLRTKEI